MFPPGLVGVVATTVSLHLMDSRLLWESTLLKNRSKWNIFFQRIINSKRLRNTLTLANHFWSFSECCVLVTYPTSPLVTWTSIFEFSVGERDIQLSTGQLTLIFVGNCGPWWTGFPQKIHSVCKYQNWAEYPIKTEFWKMI